MNWQHLFQAHILERGLEYYQAGHVEDYDEDDDYVQATVCGSKDYDVLIDVVDGQILDMNCECPYAAGGNNCKHMAAVLFHMESGQIKNSQAERLIAEEDSIQLDMRNQENSIRKLVEKADESMIRNFLVDILEHDEKLYGRFKSALNCKISREDMHRYKNQINRIFDEYAGRQGFIDYYSAGAFISELEDFLDNDVEGMLDNRQYQEAFEMTGYIFIKTGNQDMDDSDGGTGMLAAQCMEIWQEILGNCDLGLKRTMFVWFIKHLDGSVIDYMEECIEQILFESFTEDEFLKEKLAFTESKVHKYKKEKDSWTRRYHAGRWAIRHIAVLREQKASAKSIAEYCKENLEFSVVRKYYIEECIKGKDYQTAINVLEAGKETDKEFSGLVAGYSLQLKELYQQTGRQEEYERELWLLMLQYKAGDVSLYKELRSLYTEEIWKEKREIIFGKLSSSAAVDKLYKEDRLFDRLLESVLKSTGLYKLTEYESCLKKIYPEKLLNKYEQIVKNMATRTSDRKHYRELVGILKRMQKYPGGKKRVNEITDSWKSKYRNRPAMMDEINKL